MEKLLLTADETARVLSISRRKVFLLIQRGELESLKVGHSRRIQRTALVRYVEKLADVDCVA